MASRAGLTPAPPAGAAAPWPAAACGPAALARRTAACRPAATLRLGVLVNPRARAVRDAGPRLAASVAAAAAGAGPLRETRDRAALRDALAHLVGVEGVNVLATLGGDGTLHAAVNELLALTRATAEACAGEAPPLPLVFALRGGTLNIVGATLGTAGPPGPTLERFVGAYRRAPLGAVRSRPLPLLRVESAALGTRYGFVFGSEMVRNALELYDGFGGGTAGLARFLFEAFRGYAFGGELWRREGWRLDPPSTPIAVAHAGGLAELPRYAAAVACTVDLAIAGGALRALPRPSAPGAFTARVITETRAGALLAMAPALMTGRAPPGTLDLAAATSMRLAGSFTLDGEILPRLDPSAGAGAELSITVAPPLAAVVA